MRIHGYIPRHPPRQELKQYYSETVDVGLERNPLATHLKLRRQVAVGRPGPHARVIGVIRWRQLVEHVVVGDLGPEAFEQQHVSRPDAPVRHRRRLVQVLKPPRRVERDPRALRPAQPQRRRPATAAGRFLAVVVTPRPCSSIGD